MIDHTISLFSIALFGLTSFAWLSVIRCHRFSSFIENKAKSSAKSARKPDSNRISFTSLGATTVDKVSNATSDPLVQIECEIIKHEVDPVVQRIDSHNKTFGDFQPLVIGIAGGSGSGKMDLLAP
jgi:hypothetical protein